jgi:Zn-dependent protease with chaperone function
MQWLNGGVGLDGHVQRNRLRLVVLVLGFLGAAELVVLPLLGVAGLFLPLGPVFLTHPVDFALRYAPLVALAASVLFVIRWLRFPKAMGARLGAEAGASGSRRLQRLVQELAVLNGLAEPRVVVIESGALNAFAAGIGARDATIFVTSGLEAALNDAELKAVLAHEIAHLASGDTRVMAAAAVMIDTIEALRRRVPGRDGLGWKSGLLLFIMPLFGMIAKMLAGASALADTLARAARLSVAASRERIADAEAVRMTRDPAALITALRKIEGRSGIGTFPRAIEAMLIDGPDTGPEATHPPIAERIATIIGLTGAYFPLESARATPASPRAGQARSVFGKRAAPGARRLEEIMAETALGRVRHGQGDLIKTTRAYRLVPFALLLFMLWGMMSSMRARDEVWRAGEGTPRTAETGFARLAQPGAGPVSGSTGARAPKDPQTVAQGGASGRIGSPQRAAAP